MLSFIFTWRRERETIRQLARLSERELADVGISREDFKITAYRAVRQAEQDRTGIATMAPSWGSHNRRALAA